MADKEMDRNDKPEPEVKPQHRRFSAEDPAHDAYTRLLYRSQADGEALWDEAQTLMKRTTGMLVLVDSTLDTSPMHRRWIWSSHIGRGSTTPSSRGSI
jgi:hypothetical protein